MLVLFRENVRNGFRSVKKLFTKFKGSDEMGLIIFLTVDYSSISIFLNIRCLDIRDLNFLNSLSISLRDNPEIIGL